MTKSWYAASRRFVFSPAQWRRSQRRLALEMARPEHEKCRRVAAELDAAHAPLHEVFAHLCPLVCPGCPRPCCAWVDVKGLMDQTDLIHFAAMGLDDLPAPGLPPKGCAFLVGTGCALPWRARPFACLHHVCARLHDAMSAAEAEAVRLGLKRAARLRAQLFVAFLDGRSHGDGVGQE